MNSYNHGDKILTKSYRHDILIVQLKTEVIYIERKLTSKEHEKAENFLNKIRPLLSTNECSFIQRDKNIDFNRRFPLKHEEKIDIIKKLTAADCVGVGPNNNPRYAESEVYTFIKGLPLCVYGEEEYVELYIKMYLNEQKHHDIVIVISFHEAGMHE